MKARSKELLDRAIAAVVSAIEIFNKPDFYYREESFAILAINGWELLMKAKYLADNGNRLASLHAMEPRMKKDGTKSKLKKYKTTRSGNPMTHGMDYLAKRLIHSGQLSENAWSNLEVLLEMRDCSVHFYTRSAIFSERLQEVGSACIKNFVATTQAWFKRDFSDLNFYLLPLGFVSLESVPVAMLNHEEKNFLKYLEDKEAKERAEDAKFSVSVNVEVKFTKSKAAGIPAYRLTNDPSAHSIRVTEEEIREKYPWDYDTLTKECRKRFADFKVTNLYHQVRNELQKDKRFGAIRFLDPGNAKSAKKAFFSPNILPEFDKHFKKAT